MKTISTMITMKRKSGDMKLQEYHPVIIYQRPKRIWDRDTVVCKNCKTMWSLEIVRTREDYEPGVCPKCGGFLKVHKERA
jgi:hypothetical protein